MARFLLVLETFFNYHKRLQNNTLMVYWSHIEVIVNFAWLLLPALGGGKSIFFGAKSSFQYCSDRLFLSTFAKTYTHAHYGLHELRQLFYFLTKFHFFLLERMPFSDSYLTMCNSPHTHLLINNSYREKGIAATFRTDFYFGGSWKIRHHQQIKENAMSYEHTMTSKLEFACLWCGKVNEHTNLKSCQT